jgi:hypothetical protein
MSAASLERAKLFTWDAFRSKLIPGIEKAVADYGPEKRYLIPKTKDTGQEVIDQEEPVSGSEGEDSIPQGHRGASGPSEDTGSQEPSNRPVEAQAEGQEASAVANTLLGVLRSDAIIHNT